MKKVILVLCIFVLLFTVGCCSNTVDSMSNSDKNTRFVKTEYTYTVIGKICYVVVDNESNMVYLCRTGESFNVFEPLLNKEGQHSTYTEFLERQVR